MNRNQMVQQMRLKINEVLSIANGDSFESWPGNGS